MLIAGNFGSLIAVTLKVSLKIIPEVENSDNSRVSPHAGWNPKDAESIEDKPLKIYLERQLYLLFVGEGFDFKMNASIIVTKKFMVKIFLMKTVIYDA